MNLRKPPVLSEEAKARRNANLKPFKKGSSGNPSGRPREYGEVLHAAREHSLEAIETLVLVMRNGKPGEAMMAAQALLDRAWGRPKVTVDAEVQARSVRTNDRTEHRDPRTPWPARRVHSRRTGRDDRQRGLERSHEWQGMRTLSTRLSAMLGCLRRLGHAVADWCSFQMGTISIWLRPPQETFVDRAIREEGEQRAEHSQRSILTIRFAALSV
jgi:hypothetical protein